MDTLTRHADKWTPEPNTGCYLWTGAIGSHGRPQVGVSDKKTALVSRLVCEEAYGPPPTPNHQAAHATMSGCIGGLCVNDDHLRWATVSENQLDIPSVERSERSAQSWLKNKAERNVRQELKIARANGDPTYFTGKVCKNGHMSPRYTADKVCIACRSEMNARRYNICR